MHVLSSIPSAAITLLSLLHPRHAPHTSHRRLPPSLFFPPSSSFLSFTGFQWVMSHHGVSSNWPQPWHLVWLRRQFRLCAQREENTLLFWTRESEHPITEGLKSVHTGMCARFQDDSKFVLLFVFLRHVSSSPFPSLSFPVPPTVSQILLFCLFLHPSS